MQLSPGKLWGIRRLADDAGLFRMTALDQRPPIMGLIKQRKGLEEAPDAEVAAVKAVIAETLAPASSALLVDPLWAYPGCIGHVSPRQGLILTLEDHRFEDGPGGRRSASIPEWSVEKIRRIGGDAVKVLAWYRPDAAPEVIAHQQAYVRSVGEACRRFDLPFVFELLVYPFRDATHDYVEDSTKRPEMVIQSVEAFADPAYGVDIFKLESPLPAAQVPAPGAAGSTEVQRWFDRLGEAAGRPWVMLSAGASAAAFERVLHYAFKAGASGFLAGRAIWWDAFQHYPDLAAIRTGLARDGRAYLERLGALAAAGAVPWTRHPRFADGIEIAGGGFDLPHRYPGIDE
jgi:tagatose 1,6-diphosphate aldolase